MPSRTETASPMVVAGVMMTLYAYGSFVGGAGWFGINQLRAFGPLAAAWWFVLALGAVFAISRLSRGVIERTAAAAVAAAISFPVFFIWRTSVLNPDGNALTPKFQADVPRVGAHVTHDEMLELYVHSRFWYYADRWWGWSVVHSYQIASCLAGVVFVYLMFRLARRVAPAMPALFVAGAFAGGYMQLFFGDVENYTITATLVAAYLLAACRFLTGEANVWVPAAMLGLACGFHLEAAWLAPSLLYLWFVSWRREGNPRTAIGGLATAAGLPLAAALYLQFNGLPLRRFLSSHAGYALRFNGVFAVGMPASYYMEQLNLLLLLCPTVLMAVPLFVWHRRGLDETGRFLGIAAACMAVFQIIWKAQLGVYNDWNLYAVGGLVMSLFIWRTIVEGCRTPRMRFAALVLAATGWVHTYAWIAANHTHGR